ncbi:unnamed protein product, partial [Scytosiphon promiscuus]
PALVRLLLSRHRHVEGNTMPSFVEAVRLGVDVIEFDVLTTLDGVVICHHDPLIEETGEKRRP